MKAEARLTHLAKRLSDNKISNIRQSSIREMHPPYGEKGNFRKLTVTLPPEMFAQVVEESMKRKVAGEEGAEISAVIREALAEFFGKGKATAEGR
jgi:hypothetical protein